MHGPQLITGPSLGNVTLNTTFLSTGSPYSKAIAFVLLRTSWSIQLPVKVRKRRCATALWNNFVITIPNPYNSKSVSRQRVACFMGLAVGYNRFEPLSLNGDFSFQCRRKKLNNLKNIITHDNEPKYEHDECIVHFINIEYTRKIFANTFKTKK